MSGKLPYDHSVYENYDGKTLDKMNRADEKMFENLERTKLDIKAFNVGSFKYVMGDEVEIFMSGTGIDCPCFNLVGFGDKSISSGLDMFGVFIEKLWDMYIVNPTNVKLSPDGKKLKKFIKKNIKRIAL